MNKNLLSFLSAAVMALCFPLAAGAAVYNVTWGEPENGQLSVSTGYPSARLESDAEVGAGSTLYVNAVPVELHLGWIVLLNVCTLLVSVGMLVGPSYLISHIHPAKSIRFE